MHEYKEKEMKFLPHGSGQEKQSVTLGKVHDLIILKLQARYDNEINIENSIQASQIVDIDGMALEHNIYEDTDVNNKKL